VQFFETTEMAEKKMNETAEKNQIGGFNTWVLVSYRLNLKNFVHKTNKTYTQKKSIFCYANTD